MIRLPEGAWQETEEHGPEARGFTCGFCHHAVAGTRGYYTHHPTIGCDARLAICEHCNRPSLFVRDEFHNWEQFPETSPVGHLDGLGKEVGQLFEEARACFSVGAHTACAMACRKLLMNVAVSKGAEEGLQFAPYVTWLAENNWVPPNARPMLEAIRQGGNHANHRIEIVSPDTARRLLLFTSALLRFAYEIAHQLGGA